MTAHRIGWALAVLALTTAPILSTTPARALPKIATGSNCSSDWVNNAGAMACFIQGEEEGNAGASHPHYVACAGGDIFCCQDDDRGNQNCEAQAKASRATQAQWINAILGAHKSMLTRMGRYTPKPGTVIFRAAPASAKAAQ
jgi:hypothetical protein